MSAPLLKIYVTTLDYSTVGGEGVINLGMLSNFKNASVKIPMNDSREANVTLSVYDSIISDDWFNFAGSYGVYMVMLKIYYGDNLVFWGPVVTVEGDIGAGTVTLNAVDPTIRLQHHYVRYGDAAEEHSKIPEGNAYAGQVPVSGTGLRLLRDAGENTAAQNTRGVPPLGIIDGYDTSSSGSDKMTVSRGTEVWSTMKDLCAHAIGPDMDIFPITGTDGAYARLDVHSTIGFDRTAEVVYHKGWGKDNAENIVWTTGGTLVTHDHVLSSDAKYRKTVADTNSSALVGPYVKWDTTDYEVKNKTAVSVLEKWGKEVIIAYGRPNNSFTITPRTDIAQDYTFFDGFYIGDTIQVAVKRGNIRDLHEECDIMQVRLLQDGAAQHCKTEIDVALARHWRESRPD